MIFYGKMWAFRLQIHAHSYPSMSSGRFFFQIIVNKAQNL